ncbi:MAG TPA: phosphoadenylyl-sulfate reductase [Planctomycetota bacterium]
MKRLTKEEVAGLNAKLGAPQDVLRWAMDAFPGTVALAWSGAEDVAVLDMMWRIDPKRTRVFTLDTGRLNPETYELIDAVREKYKIAVDIMFPDTADVEAMVREKGMNLFYQSIDHRKLCCGVRKVEPLNRALQGLDGWITGLRKSQSITRGRLSKVEIDPQHDKIAKVNPLCDWSTAQVFEYMKANDVPKNKLHDLGYPSIGCAPCTRAVKPGEDERAGRWWWENPDSKECGLHPTP